MGIKRSKKKHGNLEPEVFNLLKMLPEEILHHKDHTLRHPSTIYFLSLLKIKDAIIDINEELSKMQETVDYFECKKLLNAQERLLLSLLSHIDDCYLILKSIHPKIEIKKEIRYTDQWLEHIKHPTIRQFKNDIQDYRKIIALIVNKIKHEHGRLRAIKFYDLKVYTVGYYVEGIDHSGTVGPNPLIHSGGDTAFSFNRDLKFNLYHVYKISHYLVQAIRGAVKKTYNLDVDLLPCSYVEIDKSLEEKTIEVLRIVSSLPYRFFNDEIYKPVPEVSFEIGDHDDISVVFSLPSSIKPDVPWSMRISTSFVIDSIHKVPYMAERS